MTHMNPIRNEGRQLRGRARGMSLIEVLVSVLVLSLGLLGIAALQSMALRGGQGSLESSQAVMAATSIIENMRANSANASSYNTSRICSAASISGSDLASNNLRDWLNNLKISIGTSSDTTTCAQITGCPNCAITVFWDDSRAGGASNRSLALEATI